MDGNLEISLDKLPLKRVDFIDENGNERFPPDVSPEEKTLSLIRRIDFGWAVQKDEDGDDKDEHKDKKQKKAGKDGSSPWQWQGMVENLMLARQELSVIIDIISTVEANDAVVVTSITKPKQLLNESLSDLAVSAATKLQCYRHLGKYFKQSAKGLEQQVSREARFYGALIRLQQNWKVKRQRMAASAPGNESFTIDLSDNSSSDPTSGLRSYPLSILRVEHDSAECPGKLNDGSADGEDERVAATHYTLCRLHKAIFDEQVFDFISREAFSLTSGVNLTGIRENFLQLRLRQGESMSISLMSTSQDDQSVDSAETQVAETEASPLALQALAPENEGIPDERIRGPLNRACYEIYLQQIFRDHVFARSKNRHTAPSSKPTGPSAKDSPSLLGHFCLSVAHRIFSSRVLKKLENVVSRTPYLQLMSQPAWNSRISSWLLFMDVPQSVLHGGSKTDNHPPKWRKSRFCTKVVVIEECIKVEGEGAPNVVGLFKESAEDITTISRYECDLEDLPMIILQQVAGQVIWWLHEEALTVGLKAARDFLCLSFELEQGESLSLAARVDPEDPSGCISWWLVVDGGFPGETKLHTDADTKNDYRKFLGHLSLDVLHSTVLDLVTLCNSGANP
ncbi:hypothetical protein MLD38_006834 [Melastoma candidum]|uniref:Uncharacterized protein n=1 Tax=Melastoma candidum TaxID=119954 RepID=A0ACB9RNT8_9MYRT|nr:hypothetical protein MLD38_006834 [Melastoma candidum]